MAGPTRPPANGFIRVARKVYNPIGFSKGYNFVLWFVFVGALMGFVAARLPFMSFYGVYCSPTTIANQMHAAPGECYDYQSGHELVGMILHLVTILPAGFLLCFQFVPIIRHKAIIVHKINGYIILLLSVPSVVGALLVGRNAFGGGLDTQYWVGFLAIIFLGSLAMAYINIKRLQIEQHRMWMLRAWFYAGSIITVRIIMFIGSMIITTMPGYYQSRSCPQIQSAFNGSQKTTLHFYPECLAYFNGSNPDKHALVHANMKGTAIEVASALGMNFGAAAWLALAIHAIGIEIYLRLTPAEHERLRNVSYQRQLEAGMKSPGNAGLTVERFGDAEPWVPASLRHEGVATTLEQKQGSPTAITHSNEEEGKAHGL